MSSVTEAAFEVDSREFIAGLDRTPLDGFVVPIEVLAAMDAHYRSFADLERGISVPMSHYKSSRALAMVCERSGIDMTVIAAEVIFWWTVSGSIPNDAGYDEKMEIHRDGVSRLVTVYENPDMHGYFLAGIWDVELIRSLIDDGVDAALAGSLAAAAAE